MKYLQQTARREKAKVSKQTRASMKVADKRETEIVIERKVKK